MLLGHDRRDGLGTGCRTKWTKNGSEGRPTRSGGWRRTHAPGEGRPRSGGWRVRIRPEKTLNLCLSMLARNRNKPRSRWNRWSTFGSRWNCDTRYIGLRFPVFARWIGRKLNRGPGSLQVPESGHRGRASICNRSLPAGWYWACLYGSTDVAVGKTRRCVSTVGNLSLYRFAGNGKETGCGQMPPSGQIVPQTPFGLQRSLLV